MKIAVEGLRWWQAEDWAAKGFAPKPNECLSTSHMRNAVGSASISHKFCQTRFEIFDESLPCVQWESHVWWEKARHTDLAGSLPDPATHLNNPSPGQLHPTVEQCDRCRTWPTYRACFSFGSLGRRCISWIWHQKKFLVGCSEGWPCWHGVTQEKRG